MATPRKVDEETIKTLLSLIDEKTTRQIAKELNLSPTHIKRLIKKHSPKLQFRKCRICGETKTVGDMAQYKTNKGHSRYKYCRDCRNLQRSTDKQLKVDKLRARFNKRKAVEMFGNKCFSCGQTFHPVCFEFHHQKEETKKGNPSYFLAKYGWKKAKKELKKCVMVCKNCHAIIHHGGD